MVNPKQVLPLLVNILADLRPTSSTPPDTRFRHRYPRL